MDWAAVLLWAIDIGGYLLAGLVGWGVAKVLDRFSKDPTQDYELWLDAEAESLRAVQHNNLGGAIEYRVKGGNQVEDPFLVEVYLWSAGKKDIRPEAFTGQRSLTIEFGVPIVSLLEDGKLVNADDTDLQLAGNSITIAPSLIRKRMAAKYRVLTDGAPSFKITNPIADLESVRSYYEEWRSPTTAQEVAKWTSRALYVIGGVVVVTGFALIPFAPAINPESPLSVPLTFLVLAPFPVVLGVIIGTFRMFAPRAAGRALKKLKKNLGSAATLTQYIGLVSYTEDAPPTRRTVR